MITRTLDAAFLTSVANHPDVRPYVGPGADELDLTALVTNPANYALETEHGGWLLISLMPGVYELHTVMLQSGRGKVYFRNAKEALRYMFARADTLEIVTRCPDDNPAARMAATLVGFRERFRREDAWAPGVGVSYQALTIDDWIARDPEIRKVGRAFHDQLEAAKFAAGSDLPIHPEDEAHDRAVGAAFLMAQHGQMNKAVGVYNRWAIFAGYATITMLAPTILDIADALLEVIDGEMKVLGVR